MIKSMTGFGQALSGSDPFQWSVEIRSWNHRFFECSARLPNVLFGLDEKIRDFIHQHVKRGKITVSISLRSKAAESNGLVLDEKKVDRYVKALRKVQKRYRLTEPLAVNSLLSIPNLFTADHREYTPEQYWASLQPVLQKAIAKLLMAKTKEGSILTLDFKKRLKLIQHSLKRIETVVESARPERFNRMKGPVLELTQNTSMDQGRLEQEIALLTERNDITEELVRIIHHVDFFAKSLATSEEVGKKLDFIAQEIHREATTIASKSQNFDISEDVIQIKSELEKIREQVQNIE
jgi:uncharacterized protein (TIGR00255 family)